MFYMITFSVYLFGQAGIILACVMFVDTETYESLVSEEAVLYGMGMAFAVVLFAIYGLLVVMWSWRKSMLFYFSSGLFFFFLACIGTIVMLSYFAKMNEVSRDSMKALGMGGEGGGETNERDAIARALEFYLCRT